MLAIADRQHRNVTREQLLGLGMSAEAIAHRIRRGRLFPKYRGVYSVGTPDQTRYGEWTAAVLACGDEALLSFECAAALFGVRPDPVGPIEISVPRHVNRSPKGIVVHRRTLTSRDRTRRRNIPVTTIATTIIDLATRLDDSELERAISEAVSRRLTTPDHLVSVQNVTRNRPGAPRLRALLTRHSFRLTDSELERLFIPLALSAGLPVPETRTYVNGFKVDFHWPELGLVVETDSLTFHRDPFQQRNDRLRDQAHTAAGLTQLRFTHWQVSYDQAHVEKTLRAVGQRLLAAAALPSPGRAA